MATIYKLPKSIPAPEPDYDNYNHKREQQKEEAFLEQLAAFCRSSNPGKLVGEIIREPWGDGYAEYMVFREKPLELFHLPLGDNWSAGAIWERGLKLSDVQQYVKFRDERRALFAKK